MKRSPFASFGAAGVALALLLAGCKSTGTAFNPPGGGMRTLHHMYLSISATVGSVQIYNLPVTSASTPSGTIAGLNRPEELFVDHAGRLFVPLSNGGPGKTVNVYSSPITSASTPAFVLTTIDASVEDTTEDAAGNVYVSAWPSSSCCIDVFNGPVNASATANFSINSNGVTPDGLGFVFGLAFDSSGTNLYVSSFSSIIKFTPPITTASTPAANVTPNQDNYGLVVDSSNRIFVANATIDGTVDVFTQPFTNASTRAFGLVVSGTHVIGMAFDGSGNLWAVDGNGVVWEVKAPITAASTPTNVLTVTNADGIAFGP
ncbi:MAG TPA: hypothetical protein VIN40_06210 [Candidatus Tyrphobacter sp.]